MRLRFVLPEYDRDVGGGIVTFYRQLLPALVRAGHRVDVIVGSGVDVRASADPRMLDGVHVESLTAAALSSALRRLPHLQAMPLVQRLVAGAWAMWEQIGGAADADVVEVADWGLLFAPWVTRGGPPVVIQAHGSSGQLAWHDPMRGQEAQAVFLQMIEALGVAQADAVQTYSSANAAVWEALTDRRVDCLRPAWAPSPPLAEATATATRAEFLVLGRVQRWKGPDTLCEAVSLLKSRRVQVEWIGRDAPYGRRDRSTAQYLAQRWPRIWGHQVVHEAQQPPAVVAARQRAAAYVVVPSLWDVFNFTGVEGLTAGVPVVCSTGAGCHELIESGVSGLTFTAGDATSLAMAMDAALSQSPDARRAMTEAALASVTRALSVDDRVEERIRAYANLQAECSPRGASRDVLRALLGPVAAEREGDWAFLDELPARAIARNLAARVRARAFGPVSDPPADAR